MPKPFINAQLLRHLADEAGGTRGKKFWFVIQPDGTLRPPIPHGNFDPDDFDDNHIVIPWKTDWTVADRPPLDYVRIKAEDKEFINLLDFDGDAHKAADAVFWSEAAVEKFLLPYYASYYGGDAAEELEKLLDLWNGKRTIQNVEIYAMAHLPKSEYVAVGGGSIALIFSEGTGPLKVLAFPAFVQRYL
ncbi:MAG TPA: hypothetical protein VFS20_29480 [Longimicrobium sp.]|nr:hypothetical protein [Longimicrobium sp.]